MGLPSEANELENFLKQSWSSSEMICWTVSQPHSPKNHPVKFLSQPCSFFQKIYVMHTHLISRSPGAYECIMPFQHNPTNISNMHILSNLQSHHMLFKFDQPTPKFAHLSYSLFHFQMSTHTIISHIIVTSS